MQCLFKLSFLQSDVSPHLSPYTPLFLSPPGDNDLEDRFGSVVPEGKAWLATDRDYTYDEVIIFSISYVRLEKCFEIILNEIRMIF